MEHSLSNTPLPTVTFDEEGEMQSPPRAPDAQHRHHLPQGQHQQRTLSKVASFASREAVVFCGKNRKDCRNCGLNPSDRSPVKLSQVSSPSRSGNSSADHTAVLTSPLGGGSHQAEPPTSNTSNLTLQDDEDDDNANTLDACDSPLLIHQDSATVGGLIAGVRCDSGAASAVTELTHGEGQHYDHHHDHHHHSQIILGVCCMSKKLRSETMTAMLKRFEEFQVFRIVAFPEDLILDAPVEQWPRVDVMISFFSSGFPLHKAVEYAHRHPDVFFLTHPASQQVLLDRRGVYSALKRNNVPTVRYMYCNRDGYHGEPPATFVENTEEEYIEVNGERFYKPFVEKPVDSEDHNVFIYYDKSRGGGCRMLFRKKENESSAFDPDRVHVRHDGSYVYEEYIETANFMDVKCYTVGVHFVHAEQRKAPCVDGIVLRSVTGKEIREEVQLTAEERMVARKVIKVFRQLVCGFDLLRSYDAQGRPTFFVCDVNGWSFVKNNPAYVNRATEIMKSIFVEEVRKRGLHRVCTAHSARYLATPSRSVDNMSLSYSRQVPFGNSGFLNACGNHSLGGGGGMMETSTTTTDIPESQQQQQQQRCACLMGGEGRPFIMGQSYNTVGYSPNASVLAATPNLHEHTSILQNRVVPRELIGVVGVLRHADRTPKQKVKILLSAEVLLDLVFGVVDDSTVTSPNVMSGEVGKALREPKTQPLRIMNKELVFKCGHPVLARIQHCAQQLLDELMTSEETSSHGSIDVVGVLHTTASRSSPGSDVHVAGIDLVSAGGSKGTFGTSPAVNDAPFPSPSSLDPPLAASTATVSAMPASPTTTRAIPFRAHAAGDNPTQSVEDQLRLIIDVLNRKHEGLKVQIRPSEYDETGKCVEALLICKWGGWLTDAGHKQAEMLGNHFIRRMFGAEPSEHCISHNQLRVTTNNERRVIYTGLDFARCLLKDTSLTESQCHVNEALLGCSSPAKDLLARIADELADVMHIDVEDAAGLERVSELPGMAAMMRCCVLTAEDTSPKGALRALHRLMKELVEHIPPNDASHIHFYRNEPIHLMRRRWEMLAKSFYNKKNCRYDTTKITDIFDYVSYDVCYNQESLAPLDLYPLFTLAEVVSQFVSDGEYGLTPEEKKLTGCLIATPLLQRINNDLHALARHQSPLTRLYFTSQSHVMALKNLLYHSEEPFHRLDEPQALHFLTHIVFKAYRYIDTGAVQLEVHFSAGMDKNMFGIVQEHHVEYSAVTPMIRIHNDLTIAALQRMTDMYSSLYNEKVPLTALSPMSSGNEGH